MHPHVYISPREDFTPSNAAIHYIKKIRLLVLDYLAGSAISVEKEVNAS